MVKPYYLKGFVINERLVESITAYIDYGRPVGDFLKAVICNDLRLAVARADETNLQNLPAFAGFFFNKAPATCWGSAERYSDWLSHKGYEGYDNNSTD